MASLTRPPLIGVDERARVRRFDWPLLASAVLLILIGIVAIYSVSARLETGIFRKQMAMVLVGILPFTLFFLVDPHWWRKAAKPIYLFNLATLAIVLVLGVSTNGSQRWIDLKFVQFQPSEMAKLATLLTLASFLYSRRDGIGRFSTFALSFVHVAIPAFLIAEQPHYGGAMVLIVIWLCVSITANVPMKYIVAAVALLAGGALAATQIPGLMHDYHLKRLQALRQEDRQGVSYQQDRAQVALGVGGLVGTGFLRGRQTLPEQQNDFIFTVIGEEFGLVGSLIVLAAYAFFFYRMWLVLFGATDPLHRMLAAGILGLFAFHTIVNLAMVLQLLPVIGLWLPFMSSGGTALWLCMAALGLLLKIRSRERPILF